jgi:carbonic anhydrase
MWSALISLAALASGCEKVRAVVCEPVKAAAPAPGHAGAAPLGAAGAKAPAHDAPKADELAGEPEAKSDKPKADDARGPKRDVLTATTKFALPFAWEKSPAEPLSRARIYLRELADDNAQYMAKGAEFFKTASAAQAPRTTVVTCTDARVQAGAFDATPENDDFTVRNIGNQLESNLGSVQYGVTQLKTPVLLVLGHTGCDAIKAALTGTSDLEEPISRELASLHLKKVKGPVDEKKVAVAVVENVHDQVKFALKQFGARVNAGELTIIGAVFDLRNDLGKGAGRLTVIDVNGNQDEARLKAFGEAIMSTPSTRGGANARESAMDRLARVLAETASANHEDDPDEDDAVGADDATLPPVLARPSAAPIEPAVPPSAMPPAPPPAAPAPAHKTGTIRVGGKVKGAASHH